MEANKHGKFHLSHGTYYDIHLMRIFLHCFRLIQKFLKNHFINRSANSPGKEIWFLWLNENKKFYWKIKGFVFNVKVFYCSDQLHIELSIFFFFLFLFRLAFFSRQLCLLKMKIICVLSYFNKYFSISKKNPQRLF